MGFLDWLIIGGVTSWVIKEGKRQKEEEERWWKEYQEEERLREIENRRRWEEDEKRRKKEEEIENQRRNTICEFNDGFSYEEFEQLAFSISKRIRRIIDIDINGPVIVGTVETQSGCSEWEFCIDFNDFGHITGEYWLWSDNDDSSIPDRFVDLMLNGIEDLKKR